MLGMKRVLLIRHAECEANLVKSLRVQGQSPSNPLTALGILQAKAFGKHFETVAGQKGGPVFASTAVRAHDTARIALQEMQIVDHPITLSKELLEVSQGQWEGALRADCYTPEVLARIANDPWRFAAPGGESQKEVEERMSTFIRDVVLPNSTLDGPPALVFSHGLAIKCFLRGVLSSSAAMARKIAVGNTSITEVAWVEAGGMSGWQLLRVNDRAHLVLEGIAGLPSC
mmetsp:Transcript_37447/g.83328  ORF Transcript_37447/g.83328 Transcript_37447/m.83328 type:complete len:229 (-) Transcript_37447:974-1660(-)